MTENPYEHTSWFEKHLGSEAFDKLIIRSNIPTKPDKEAIKLYLQEKIKNLEEL